MRAFVAMTMVALSSCAFGAGHVFSMSCKVTSCNRDLGTPAGRARAMAWMRTNGVSKVWLETYRHAERVASDRMREIRDDFRRGGFVTAGLITPTQLNDAPEGAARPMVVCWSDPVARRRLREEVARAAELFDTVILDDFLFSECAGKCPRCSADKARRCIDDWGAYRRALMMDVCRDDILSAARQTNRRAHFIIKYPCWWQNWNRNGYSPAEQAELFGECWVGTETRDANPNPLQACWIMDHAIRLSKGRCGGGWYDALDCTPEKFVEQAYYTLLGGAKESLLHCYDYLLSDDPGTTPFGEKADRAHACARAFERENAKLRAFAAFMSDATRGTFAMGKDGVSTHELYKDGKAYRARLNTTSRAVDGLPPHGFKLEEL